MLDIEDIRLYLPKYLSPETEEKLFRDLRDFPANIDKRMYGFSGKSEQVIYQGDGINNLIVVSLPDHEPHHSRCMVISNTCDIDLENIRRFSSNIVYSPIIEIDKYCELMIRNGVYDNSSIRDHLSAIRRQLVTQIFYLPRGQLLQKEALVFFDRLVSCDNRALNRGKLRETRLFSLSQYGWYLFLYKLSIHFTRIHERIDRKY